MMRSSVSLHEEVYQQLGRGILKNKNLILHSSADKGGINTDVLA
jgi:hypothetical protein